MNKNINLKDNIINLFINSFWNDKEVHTGFVRLDLLQPIYGYVGNKLIKILLGQRGAGKAFVMRQLAQHLIKEGVSSRNILYIDRSFTDTDLLQQLGGFKELLSAYRERLRPIGKIYIFIEEVQNTPDWLSFVNECALSLTDSCEVFLSSSDKQIVYGDTEMVLGRHCVSFSIYPFSFREYSKLTGCEATEKNFGAYMDNGSLPLFYSREDREGRRNAVVSLLYTTIYRDILCCQRIKDARFIEIIMSYLAEHLSEALSINDIVNHFSLQGIKTSYDTVANDISYLEDIMLLHRVERMNIKTQEVISGSCRYFFNDWGFVKYLFPLWAGNEEARFKNYIFIELKRSGYAVSTGISRGSTIDFVAQQGDRYIYIQCLPRITADELNAEKLYSSLLAIHDNYEKWIVSMDTTAYPSRQGIRHIQAWKVATMLNTYY